MVSQEDESDSAALNDVVSFVTVHHSLNVFDLKNAQRYFTIETILKEKLKDDNLEVYLDKNIFLALDRIFDKQCVRVSEQSQQDLTSGAPKTESNIPLRESTALGARPDPMKSPTQLVKRLRLDLSLPNCNADASVCILSPENTPERNQMSTSIEAESDQNSESEPDSSRTNPADLCSLFYLMSLLPDPAASYCKRVMDRDDFQWKISLYNIIMVFLNWGATLKSLDLDEMFNSSAEMFSPVLEPPPITFETAEQIDFPKSSNVRLVMAALEQRLPPESQVPQSFWSVLTKILTFGAMDTHQKQNFIHFSNAMSAVLNSMADMNDDKSSVIVNEMGLMKMDPQVSVRVCCHLLNMRNERFNFLGLMASHYVLHHVLGFTDELSFSGLVNGLHEMPELLERFSLEHVYCIVQHIHNLLVRHAYRTPPCSEEAVEKLNEWSIGLRITLKKYPYKFNFDSSYVRERLARVSSECATILRKVFNNSISNTFITNFTE